MFTSRIETLCSLPLQLTVLLCTISLHSKLHWLASARSQPQLQLPDPNYYTLGIQQGKWGMFENIQHDVFFPLLSGYTSTTSISAQRSIRATCYYCCSARCIITNSSLSLSAWSSLQMMGIVVAGSLYNNKASNYGHLFQSK